MIRPKLRARVPQCDMCGSQKFASTFVQYGTAKLCKFCDEFEKLRNIKYKGRKKGAPF